MVDPLYQPGLIAHQLIDLSDALVDLLAALRDPGDALARCHRVSDRLFDPGQLGIHLAGGAQADILDLADDGVDLGGGAAGAGRQRAHFIGHHGKTASLFACPRRFNGGVQRQQIGLLRNIVNGARQPGDLLREASQIRNGLGDLLHSRDLLPDHLFHGVDGECRLLCPLC